MPSGHHSKKGKDSPMLFWETDHIHVIFLQYIVIIGLLLSLVFVVNLLLYPTNELNFIIGLHI